MVRVVVALSGEVDPLGVSELVTNEVQVSLSSQRLGDGADDVENADSVEDYGSFGESFDIPLYIAASISQNASVLSPTRLWS